MKRIAFISEHASPFAILGGVDAGGQNVYVSELAKQLAAGGYLVDIFTRRESPDVPRCVQWEEGVRVIHVDAGPPEVVNKEKLLPYMAAFRNDMLAFIKSSGIRYDLMHANFFMSALVAMEIKAILNIPYVVTFHALGHIRKLHQGEQDQFPAERVHIEEQAMHTADAIIAECPQDQEDLLRYYHPAAEKIKIVPCGVNLDELYRIDKQAARERLGLPQDEIILLQLGRMVPRKGIDNVIRSLASLDCQRRHIRLLVVGGDANLAEQKGTELFRLRQVAIEAGVQAAVTFTGQRKRDELKYYYSAADLFITTPWYEPFGITPLEAMACGTPVIGADVGGIKYSVADGVTGRLVPPNDPDALAGAVDSLLANPQALTAMGAQAISRVKRLFTWNKVASQLDGIYSNIISRYKTATKELSEFRRAV